MRDVPNPEPSPSRRPARRDAGFTLIELALTLAITGILASIAIPFSYKMIMRAKRSEAVLGLEGIHKAQIMFYGEYGLYAGDFDELGFSLVGGQRIDANTIEGPEYTFEMEAFTFNGVTKGNFWATATGDLQPGDGVLDVLLLENDVTVLN